MSTVRYLDTRWRTCLSSNFFLFVYLRVAQVLNLVFKASGREGNTSFTDHCSPFTRGNVSVYSHPSRARVVPHTPVVETWQSNSSVEPWPQQQPITSPLNSLSALMLFYCNLIMLRFPVGPGSFWIIYTQSRWFVSPRRQSAHFSVLSFVSAVLFFNPINHRENNLAMPVPQLNPRLHLD